ncbi:enhanced intracellular survival protein Eis [Pediococcus siamensis]|uniref:GNAT family N-acetyltransferase n=1 Tax=Pediococcus siamensis TaxID=381829 RepID=UPI0039A0A95E
MNSHFRLDNTAKKALYNLYLYAFNKPDSEFRRQFWTTRFEHGIPYGIYADRQLVSGLFSMPFKVNFHGHPLLMNGITDVMSAPEYSGKGGAGSLMKAALVDMYENHVVLSYLAPFSFAYYRKFGYEQVFDHQIYRLSSPNLPRLQNHTEGQIHRHLLKNGITAIKAAYLNSPLSQNGGLIRQDWWWQYLTEKHPDWEVAIYQEKSQPVTGYLVYSRTTTEFQVHEFVHATPASYQALASFVFKHGTGYQTYTFENADPNYQGDLLADPYMLSVTTQPYMMARIVNLQAFFAHYPIQQAEFAPISFNVEDDVVPQNSGNWFISATAGKIGLEHDSVSKSGAPNLTMQQLTKAMMGYRTLASQSAFGQLTDSAELAKLDQIFIHQKPILADYF